MTLIIGCITKENAVIAGDTQLTVDKGEGNQREIEIKVNKYGTNFMLGILGKWSWFYTDNKVGRGKATYYNEYKNLRKALSDYKIENKLDFTKIFLEKQSEIEATAIYINKDLEKFELNFISTEKENDNMIRIELNGKILLFNEPFFHTCKSFVEDKIRELNKKYKLTDSLEDVVFLMNYLEAEPSRYQNKLN